MPTTTFDVALEEGQDCLKLSPVIVLGSGASIPTGLPSMGTLANHLRDSVGTEILSETDRSVWDRFTQELATKDLESALQAVTLTDRLSDSIIEHTWKLVREADERVFHKILDDRNYLPLSRLYRHLFHSTNRVISVVTPNYDRLAEYSADAAGHFHYTGFNHGYVRQRLARPQLSITYENQHVRMVDIWKVHGCLDWFVDEEGEVIALMSARSIPPGRRPAIVTPGVEKYERTHREPFRSIIAGADAALSRARAYLCVGFGFNDAHIQPKLLERWRSGDAFLVVLTKTLSVAAERMLNGATDGRFMVLEEAEGGTRMRTQDYREGVLLEGVSLWKLADFLEHTT